MSLRLARAGHFSKDSLGRARNLLEASKGSEMKVFAAEYVAMSIGSGIGEDEEKRVLLGGLITDEHLDLSERVIEAVMERKDQAFVPFLKGRKEEVRNDYLKDIAVNLIPAEA